MNKLQQELKRSRESNEALNWKKEPNWEMTDTSQAQRWADQISTAEFEPRTGFLSSYVNPDHLEEYIEWLQGLLKTGE